MDYRFDGKVAVVSGGSRGIGRTVARRLVEGGASVAFAGRTQSNVDHVVEELTELGPAGGDGAVLGVTVDLTEAAGVERLVEETLARFPGVDVLVNNVGDSGYGLFLDLDDDVIVSAWTLKALTAIRLTRALAPSMEARGGGAVVNIGGTSSIEPTADGIPAAVANASLRVFTKGAAAELARRGISINSITPFWVHTDRHLERAERQARERGQSVDEVLRRIDAGFPTGRVTTADEVAELALFLASRRVPNLTGADIVLDGGATRAV
jgi:3-oxoacyl-[acyl-carrier protein] reductase